MKDSNSLFSTGPQLSSMPLAERMRPRSLDEFIGQDHIVGPGRLLRRAISADRISSLLFSGPPGTGKTTLARIIAGHTQSAFLSLNAVLSGVAEIRSAIEKASNARDLHDQRTILFVDEVHRWNKAQQDALLPWVENGTIKLIGATTENPFFEVNAALVSRSRVFLLQSLTRADMEKVALQALRDPIRGYGAKKVKFENDALEHLIDASSGDARTLLNALELAVETTEFKEGDQVFISRQIAEDSIQQKILLYDKDGDYHFDTISAFIKSIRGSDPDAALYWLVRMIAGGEDPKFILRRLCIAASEDIGLANPEAIVVANACAQSFERVGMPEGQFFLSQACLYLASSPKSNSTMGYFDALAHIKDSQNQKTEVPLHLRDSSRDGPDLGHGKNYIYPHAYRDHWVAQNYLPKNLREQVFYQPSEEGYEQKIRQNVLDKKWHQLAKAVDLDYENLTAQPRDIVFDRFLKRTESEMDPISLELAQAMVSFAKIARHERIGLVGSGGLFMIPHLIRAVPEGLVSIKTSADSVPGLGEWLSNSLPKRDLDSYEVLAEFSICPEKIFIWDWKELHGLELDANSIIMGLSRVRAGNSRPSSLISEPSLKAKLIEAENLWLGEYIDSIEDFESALELIAQKTKNQLVEFNFQKKMINYLPVKRNIIIDQAKIKLWTDEDGDYSKQVLSKLNEDDRKSIFELWQSLEDSSFPWLEAFVLFRLLT